MRLHRVPAICGLLLLVLASAGFHAPARAQGESLKLPPAAFKALPEGTRMVWENMDSGKRVESIVGRTRGLIVSWIWEGHSYASFAHICMDCVAAGLPPDGGELGKLFPLEVGKQVGFTRRWAGQAWRDTIKVIGTERITVPAGTYDTYVLLRDSEMEGSDWRAEERVWYAPNLGWVVKFEGYNSRGAGERWQAVSFN